jgi:hypothetical protein
MELIRPVSNQLTKQEILSLSLAAMLLIIALIGVAYDIHIPQHDNYHAFADQRPLFNLPFAADVTSNLPFALAGIYGLVLILRQKYVGLGNIQLRLFGLSFIGLILTMAASGFYHVAPNNFGLSIDRLGMTSAFAGIVGLAISGRVSDRAGQAGALAILVFGPLAVAHWYETGNLWLWSVVQGGGMLALLLLALRPARPDCFPVQLGWIIALYVLAKILEGLDHQIYAWSHSMISGHTLKHLAAAAAAWPLIRALRFKPAPAVARR